MTSNQTAETHETHETHETAERGPVHNGPEERKTQVLVIGAGPAGVAAARAAASGGADTIIVGTEPPGGRAGWHSLLPSKVLLTAADTLGRTGRVEALGLASAASGVPDVGALTRRMRQLSQSRSADHVAELRDLGVQIVIGKAAFLDAHRVEVAGANGDAVAGAAAPLVIEADSIVVASGSVAMFPPGLEPDGNRIIAPKLALKLEGLPSSIALVGAGVTGTEFVYAFNRLGVAVTWLVDEYGVLPPFERDTTAELVAALEGRGVERHEGIAVQSVVADEEGVTSTLRDGRSFRTDMAFIAIGRRPDVAGLNLEAAGLPMDARLGIEVDEFSRSSVPGIYAAGDVTGMPMTANKALAQGWIAGWHAAGAAVSPYRPETVISAVYSDPQVAQVGLTEEEAGREGRKVEVHRLGYESGLKPLLMDETRGFVKLVADDGDGTILGASAVGAHAANLLAPIALGIRLGARLEDLAAIFAAYPGLSELPFAAARSAALESD